MYFDDNLMSRRLRLFYSRPSFFLSGQLVELKLSVIFIAAQPEEVFGEVKVLELLPFITYLTQNPH